jgi:hypothetical protein
MQGKSERILRNEDRLVTSVKWKSVDESETMEESNFHQAEDGRCCDCGGGGGGGGGPSVRRADRMIRNSSEASYGECLHSGPLCCSRQALGYPSVP